MQITDSCYIVLLSYGAIMRVSGWILLGEEKGIPIDKGVVKGAMTSESTCQGLKSEALSLNRESKQLYF